MWQKTPKFYVLNYVNMLKKCFFAFCAKGFFIKVYVFEKKPYFCREIECKL